MLHFFLWKAQKNNFCQSIIQKSKSFGQEITPVSQLLKTLQKQKKLLKTSFNYTVYSPKKSQFFSFGITICNYL